jgi:hypothetical protein
MFDEAEQYFHEKGFPTTKSTAEDNALEQAFS